ncbi:hypothetical protein TNCV_4197481 [Trichonephila clavipes]|nr:hypothetical protein TNCV_4197481 [Trichonephila clavipes]
MSRILPAATDILGFQLKERASRTPNSLCDHRRRAHHAGTTWSGATKEEHVLRREVRAGLVARRSDILNRLKDWAEGVVQ